MAQILPLSPSAPPLLSHMRAPSCVLSLSLSKNLNLNLKKDIQFKVVENPTGLLYSDRGRKNLFQHMPSCLRCVLLRPRVWERSLVYHLVDRVNDVKTLKDVGKLCPGPLSKLHK